jgi:cytochrome c oxidase subunit 2
VYLSQRSNNVIHSFWVPELNGKKDVMPGRVNHNTIEASKPGTFLGACAEYCGLAHADMRFRVIAQPMDEWKAWLADQQGGPAQPWSGDIEQLTAQKYQCTNCHIFNDSTKTNFGPNLTHLASRSTFAGGTYEVNRKNLVDWVLDAPSMVPMQSKDCRLPPPATCVGMPSFTKNTPKGQPVMTRADAETIVDYLLEEK